MDGRALSLGFILGQALWSPAPGVQQERSDRIEKIVILGNERMTADSVRRVMDLREGEPAGPEEFGRARERLESLGLFSQIVIEDKTGERGRLVIVSLKEKKLLFVNPVINLGGSAEFAFSEEDEKTYYGCELGLNDFSGHGHHLTLAGGVGALKKISLGYEKTAFSGFVWGGDFQNSWYHSDIIDTDVMKLRGSAFAGLRLARWEGTLSAGYDRIQAGTEPPARTVDNNLRAGLTLAYDGRDWDLFPARGFLARAGAFQVWRAGGGSLYTRYGVEAAFFQNVWADHVLALDAVATFTSGTAPFYDRLYFGGPKTLRGVPVGRYSGSQTVVASCEYRIPLSRFAKARPEAFPQGTAAYLFLDAGTIADRISDLRRQEIILNPGAGLFLILAPEGGLRLDLSVYPKLRLTVSSVWKF